MPNHWRPYAKRTKTLEKKYIPAITRLITRYRSKFISAYKQNPGSARQVLSQQVFNESVAKLIRSIYRNAGGMGARMLWDEQKKQVTLKDMFHIARMQTKAGGFGRNETWIREVIAYLRLHMLKMVSSITDNMREDILKILEESVDKGWGIDETVRRLQQDRILPRARLIARTEINNAANAGHRIAAESLPYEVDKGWVAAEDHRTRKGHKEINNHWVGEDDLFNVPLYDHKGIRIGYEEMEGPGDPTASAANVCNCRCRRIYRAKRDSDTGALILRNPNQARIIPMRRQPALTGSQIAAILKQNISVTVK